MKNNLNHCFLFFFGLTLVQTLGLVPVGLGAGAIGRWGGGGGGGGGGGRVGGGCSEVRPGGL